MRCSDQFKRRQSQAAQSLCLILDVRGQSREKSIQVFSPCKKTVVNLPRKFLQNRTPEAKRWCAMMVPRWLMHREGLYAPRTDEPEIEFGKVSTEEFSEYLEKQSARIICDHENRYRCLPGQTKGFGGNAGWSNAGT